MTDRQTDRQTDGRTDARMDGRTDARGKTICLPTLSGGDIITKIFLLTDGCKDKSNGSKMHCKTFLESRYSS